MSLVGRSIPLVFESGAMRVAVEDARRVAPLGITLMLEGETGSGKEVLALAVHTWSPRAGRDFVPIDCSAISETLIESELFGHERGAFTGAVAPRVGLLEQASGGTAFLDELQNIPLHVQPKLLRALESREIRRIGGNATRFCDVRFVVASNVPIDALRAKGALREDLYFRLRSFLVRIPPLRERPEDLPGLATSLLREVSGRPEAQVDAETVEVLRRYHWPGNVRELKRALEEAWVRAMPSPLIRLVHLPEYVRCGAKKEGEIPFRQALKEYERQLLLEALARRGGNIDRTARALSMPPSNLRYRLARLGVKPAQGRRTVQAAH